MIRQRRAIKDITQYDHADKKRKHNSPVGLVTPATDQGAGKIMDDRDIKSLEIVEVKP